MKSLSAMVKMVFSSGLKILIPSIFASNSPPVGFSKPKNFRWCSPRASPHIFSPISSLGFFSTRHTFRPFSAVVLAARQPAVPAPTIIAS